MYRHAFYEELRRMFEDSCEEQVSAVVFDIDGFKEFNDLYGHNAGGKVLKRVARILLENTWSIASPVVGVEKSFWC